MPIIPRGLGTDDSDGTTTTVGEIRIERVTFRPLGDRTSSRADTPFEANPQTNPFSVIRPAGEGQEILVGHNGNDFTVAPGIYMLFSYAIINIASSPTEDDASMFWEVRKSSDNSILASSTRSAVDDTGDERIVNAAYLVLDARTEINIYVYRLGEDFSLPDPWHLDFLAVARGSVPAPKGLTVEQVRDAVAAFINDGRGISVTHDDEADVLTIALNAATEGNIGGVRNVSTGEASDPAGTIFRAWSSAMITKVVGLWRVVMPAAEAEAGASDVGRFMTAAGLRAGANAAIRALVPAVFRTGNVDRIDPAKLGTGVRGEETVLHGDGAWRTQAGGLMRELANIEHTSAVQTEQRIGDFQVPNDNNVVLLVEINSVSAFYAGDDFVALRFADGSTVDDTVVYSNADRHFLIRHPTNTSRSVRVWEIEDVEAFAQIAARFLPTVSETDAEAGTSQQRRIWSALRVWQAARAATADSVTGLSRSGQVLTGTRRGGSNPIEVTLPGGSGGGVALDQVGSRFTHSGANSDEVYHATGITLTDLGADDIAYIRSASPGDADPPQYNIIRGDTLDGLTVKADGDAIVATDWRRYWPGSVTGISITRTADNELLASGHGGATAGWWLEVYRPGGAADDVRSGLVSVGNWKPPSDGTASDTTWQATGIILPDSPPDDALFEVFAHIGAITSSKPIRGSDLKTLPTKAAGDQRGSDGFTVDVVASGLQFAQTAARELLLSRSTGTWDADVDFVYLYRIQTDASFDHPGGYVTWERWDGTQTTPRLAFAPISTSTQIPVNGDVRQTLLTDSINIVGGAPVSLQYVGGLHVARTSGGDGKQIIEVGLAFQVFRGISEKQFTRTYSVYYEMGRNEDSLLPMPIFSDEFMLEAGTVIPVDGGGTYIMTEADFASPIPFQLELLLRGYEGGDPTTREAFPISILDWPAATRAFVVRQVPLVGEQAAPNPSITEFTLTGDLMPAAGDIGGDSYDFETAIAHSTLVTAARLVGFTGTTPGGAVTVLRNLTQAEFHAATGRITLPGSIVLAADGIYTVRLEVYGTGQTVGTDDALTHQDRRITAHTPATAAYHMGAVQYSASDAGVADTLARITDFSGDYATGGTATSLPSTLPISVPADSNDYQVYLFAKADQAQPTGFTSAGLPATASFYAAQDKTIGGVAYKVFILKPIYRVTSADNGQSFGVTS